MRSLRTTLGLGLIISLIALVLLQWWLVSFTFREITENYVVSRLQRDIDMLLSSITFQENQQIRLQLDQPTYFKGGPFSGHYYQISTGNKVLRSDTLWDENLNVDSAATGELRQQRLSGPLDQQLLALTQGFRKQGQTLSITVAEDITAIQTEISEFQMHYLLLSVALLLLLLLLQHFLMRQTLSPLRAVQGDLQKLAGGEIHTVRETVPEEILPLVREVNRLLLLLNQRVERSRRMVGNLAHALKTPLSVLIQLSESAELKHQPRIRRQIVEQTQTIRERLERELSRARLAGDSTSNRRFNPAQDLPALIHVLQQAYPDKSIRLTVNADTPSWPAEREDMLELSGNLIDNACKWATGKISVLVPASTSPRLIVEDDGPGCSTDSRERLSERGQRFDEQTDGYGLGLSIAHDIIEHYNGDLTFAESAAGGLKVIVRLPEPIST